MRYSLRSLMAVMLLSGPAVALVWWLRGNWTVQVLAVLALMTVTLCVVCWLLLALITICERLVKLWSDMRD